MLSASTVLSSGALTINIDSADQVNIAVNGRGKFTISDITNPTIGGQGAGPFTGVTSIAVNISATGAIVSAKDTMAESAPKPNFIALSGNFTVTDTQPNNAIGLELDRGFSVGGAVSISNTGPGSTFQQHQTTLGSETETVPGVFLDGNNRASYGSVSIAGPGTVGFDGATVLGSATVNFDGSAPSNAAAIKLVNANHSGASSFVSDRETVFNEDPYDMLAQFNQNPTTIMGNLSITGGGNVELYNTVVNGAATIAEDTRPNGPNNAILGNVAVGKDLSITTAGATNGVFLDFSTVRGKTSISEGDGRNVIGLMSDVFTGNLLLSQGVGPIIDAIFIDSEAALQAVAPTYSHPLPTDGAYLSALANAGILPPDTGTQFVHGVNSTQGTGIHQLEIGQDPTATTTFAVAAKFTIGKGKIVDVSVTSSGVTPIVKATP